MTETKTAPKRAASTKVSTSSPAKRPSRAKAKTATAPKVAPATTSPRVPAVDMFASSEHFLEHMLPGFLALPKASRGSVLVLGDATRAAAERRVPEGVKITQVDEVKKSDAPVMVGSFADLVLVRDRRRRVLYTEHGMGMSYGNGHPSYPGAQDRGGVEAIFSPNERAADLDRAVHPDLPIYVVGTPKLDGVKQRPALGRVVVVSFHWDCKVAPETRSAFGHYKHALLDLKRAKDFTVIGHSHPRPGWRKIVRSHFERFEIPFIETFDEVLDTADAYVVDNSSTLYEAAAAGRPTVAMNAPWYRQGLKNRVRLYDLIPGAQVNLPNQLVPTIRKVLDEPERWEPARQAAVAALYPHLGQASDVMAKAIITHLTKSEG